MSEHGNAIQRLEAWRNGHKSRSCLISVDDGYGATCWSVELRTTNGKDASAYEAQFIEGIPPDHIAIVMDPNGDDDDWPGLEATIHAAIDRWEKLYGDPARSQ